MLSSSKRLKDCVVNGTLIWETYRVDLLYRHIFQRLYFSPRNVPRILIVSSKCASDRQPITHRHGIIIICTAWCYRIFDLQLAWSPRRWARKTGFCYRRLSHETRKTAAASPPRRHITYLCVIRIYLLAEWKTVSGLGPSTCPSFD